MSLRSSIFLYFCIILFISCKKDEKSVIKSDVKKFIRNENFKINPDEIFGVFQLTDKDFAICITVQFDSSDDTLSTVYTKLLEKDSLPWINNKPMGKYVYYDSLYVHPLIYQENFEKIFRKKFDNQYFVYGLNGKAKSTIEKIVFSSNECGNDFIALIIDIPHDIGHAILASKMDIPLTLFSNKKVSFDIKLATEKESTENIYGSGNYSPIVFAKYQNYYFAYYDNFTWFKKSDESGMQFLERTIVEKKKDKYEVFWASGMDLLGLPCL